MRELAKFFRTNPQVLVLLLITVILGIGTFVAVLISLAQNSNGTPSGEPSGVIMLGLSLLR